MPAISRHQFLEQGYLGPVQVLSEEDCRRLLQLVRNNRDPIMDWPKSRAVTSRAIFDVANDPRVMDTVSELLDGRVMLWGAQVLSRAPGVVHPWHSDVESASCGGRTVSVWIGLRNTTRDSALALLSHSHLLETTVQKVQHQNGKTRDATTSTDILAWAREHDQRSDLVISAMSDGDALFFDGRLWHGSNNTSKRRRWALLLQYASPEVSIHIPDANAFEWPFRQLEVPRPPCMVLRGRSGSTRNRVVPGPISMNKSSGSMIALSSRIHPLRLPLQPGEPAGWRSYPMFRGCTADLSHFTCHASVLPQRRCPHPPHRHNEEELLLMLAGEADLLLPDLEASMGSGRKRLRAGEFVYYPAQFKHSLEAVSAEPATYLMFKWRNGSSAAEAPEIAFGHYSPDGHLLESTPRGGFDPRMLLEGPTRWLRKLQSHVTTLAPGAGYPAHIDSYDVAMVVLRGEVETLGARARPHDVIFYRAGEPHGILNATREESKYLVFEFHGRVGLVWPKRSWWSYIRKAGELRRWKRKIRALLR